jgi:hypothetical protein
MPGRLVFWILNSGFRIPCWRPLRPPASLRGTLRVAKWLKLREALWAGLCVRFQPPNV